MRRRVHALLAVLVAATTLGCGDRSHLVALSVQATVSRIASFSELKAVAPVVAAQAESGFDFPDQSMVSVNLHWKPAATANGCHRLIVPIILGGSGWELLGTQPRMEQNGGPALDSYLSQEAGALISHGISTSDQLAPDDYNALGVLAGQTAVTLVYLPHTKQATLKGAKVISLEQCGTRWKDLTVAVAQF